ncbi:MAG: hypothetical protein QF415_05870 [Candidatus Undinarchaeales archaeon]|jgi:hypothetical protein|nr:hypothetical protein [Candidatus Undinarchaeales archaeon]MDP7491421.1 hypothetical protein [Candidatus Undinarchaeales archaeon]
MGAITYHLTLGCGNVDQHTKTKVMDLIRNISNALMGDVSKNLDFNPPDHLTLTYFNPYGAEMNLYRRNLDDGTLAELCQCSKMELSLQMTCKERAPREVSDFSPDEHSVLKVQFQYDADEHGPNTFDVLITKGFPEPLVNYFGGTMQVKHPGLDYLNRDIYAIVKLDKIKNYMVGFAGNWFGPTFFMHFLKWTKHRYAPDRVYFNMFGQKFSFRRLLMP